MSSIAKSGISLSKKDLTKSRIPLVASRNVTFYHKASGGELSINLLALSMPSEMPTNVQATASEISGAQLAINKKNLTLQSSANGLLQQGLHYVVTSSTTINLIGLYAIAGAEVDEIFTGTINSAPISDLVVASAKSVAKTYELAVGQNILNLGYEYQTGQNINDDIGIIKVFVNGVLAIRGTDYEEVDAGSGYGTTINFFAAPPSIPYQVVVDFGVMSITDNNAIGTIESLSGAVIKLAADLADVAGTDVLDYLTANPSEIERRAFGDMVLIHERILDVQVPTVEMQNIAVVPTVNPSGSNILGAATFSDGTGIFSYDSATGIYTVIKKALFNLTASGRTNSAGILAIQILLDGVQLAQEDTVSGSGFEASVSYSQILTAGQTFRFLCSGVASNASETRSSVAATASSSQTIRQLLGL